MESKNKEEGERIRRQEEEKKGGQIDLNDLASEGTGNGNGGSLPGPRVASQTPSTKAEQREGADAVPHGENASEGEGNEDERGEAMDAMGIPLLTPKPVSAEGNGHDGDEESEVTFPERVASGNQGGQEGDLAETVPIGEGRKEGNSADSTESELQQLMGMVNSLFEQGKETERRLKQQLRQQEESIARDIGAVVDMIHVNSEETNGLRARIKQLGATEEFRARKDKNMYDVTDKTPAVKVRENNVPGAETASPAGSHLASRTGLGNDNGKGENDRQPSPATSGLCNE